MSREKQAADLRRANLRGADLVIIKTIINIALSWAIWAITAGLIYLICFCFSWKLNFAMATGIWFMTGICELIIIILLSVKENKMKIKIKLDKGARMPTRAHETYAGLDIYAREKQIEEMARKMCRNYQPNGNCASDGDPCGLECIYGYCAERIYCAGYRKQSKGEWHYPPYAPFGGSYEMKQCSVCGYKPDFDSDSPYTKFCPNCGAKMKGADDEQRED